MNGRRALGSVSVLTALSLPLVVGLCGLALELSMAFQRQSQLQQVADTVALTAAQQLDGTAAGIAAAYSKAMLAVAGRNVRGAGNVALTTAALSFAGSADGAWTSYDSALAAPSGLRYARADMSTLGDTFTILPLAFGRILGASDSTAVGARAVAGPNAMRVLPMAICAPSSTPVATRANGSGLDERIDYGLRSGVGYNLLALNPSPGASSGEHFLVDPITPPGSTPIASSTDNGNLAPFICSGKLAYASLSGALHLRRNASFGLWQQLNSRFGSYGGSDACDPYSAPPDTNVREYKGNLASWMNSNPPQATAAPSTPAAGKPLMTIADNAPPLPAVASSQYGTLWAYGPAKRSSGASFGTASWGGLYPAAPALSASGWIVNPAPYANPNSSSAPALPGRRERRLLYVPLLSCPIAAGTYVDGAVLAVARFLLTAQASATEVPGEFAGILSAKEIAALATDVELVR